MSQEIILDVQNLRKDFLLSHSGVGSLKTAILWWQKRRVERLEVLRGINLQVQKGESVALVGRNGAGKSTLLSLISKIYKPSSGSIQFKGRVGPLLELGSGFHPDLTGTENVFFNGIILGLTRKQVAERIQDIVSFSELGTHIDTPVRTYSSGMLARLGFSVAVHIDADLLIVDEVLAVGDFAFEQKCYQFLDAFRQKGGTILFVSHDDEAVQRVATRCVWLKHGLIEMDGNPQAVLDRYHEDVVVHPQDTEAL